MDFKEQLKKAYDKDAKRRDKAEGKRDQWKVDIRQEFADLLKKENKITILELGSGVGLDAKFFQDSGFDVLVTDLSEGMVNKCKKRGLKAQVADLYNLTSLGRKFDGIFSMNVLLHVPRKDLESVLDTIANTLNGGGIFYYGVYGDTDEERTFADETEMILPRFFSFLSDETLLGVVKQRFEVVDFQSIKVKIKKQDFCFQSLFLRKRQ